MKRLVPLIAATVLIATALVLYAGALSGPFAYDDREVITGDLPRLLEGPWHQGLARAVSSARPVAMLSFAANYWARGLDPWGFRLVNILLHGATGFLLFLFLRDLLSLPAARFPRRSTGQAAFFCALVWLAHPLDTQSVTYIVQRMNAMASAFFLLALVLYVRARLAGPVRRRAFLFALCGASGLAAVGSKETAATLPVFLFLVEWFFFQELSWQWLRSRARFLAAGLAGLALLALLLLDWNPLARLALDYRHRDFTMGQRVMTEWRVVVQYLGQFLLPLPSRLSLVHDVPVSRGLLAPPSTLAAGLFLLALAAGAAVLARRFRLAAFAVFWLLGNLAMESSVVGLDLMFEHRMYLPSMLLPVALAAPLYRRLPPRAVSAGLCAAALVLGAWTVQRNQVWTSALALWEDAAAKAPESALVHNNLATAFWEKGDAERALGEFRRAADLDPDYYLAQYNLGVALREMGRVSEAAGRFAAALAIEPENLTAVNDLATALLSLGRAGEAREVLERGLDQNPDSAPLHANLGLAWLALGDREKAVAQVFEAIQIDPGFLDGQLNMAVVLAALGRSRDAVGHLRQALAINPDDAQVHANLGTLLLHLGETREAARHLARALELAPASRTACQGMKRLKELERPPSR
ncbi:MAG: tetratricopeptide repeat protein [Pseudomonadota bacterium]